MNIEQKERKKFIIYINALCNLRCTYCYINKGKRTDKLDSMICKSFDNDYYINLAKELFPNKENLEIIETWGGEPLLTFDRFIKIYGDFIEYFPNLYKLMFSTNLSHDKVIDSFNMLFNLYKKFPERKFKVRTQISIDGMADVNDKNRGTGVTGKILKNFDKLIDFIKEYLPENVEISLNTKSTATSEELDIFSDKEYLIKYFQFFDDNFIDKVRNLNNPRITIAETTYNFATPYNWSKEDGIKFSKICKLSKEIEKENKEKHYFKYHTTITPFNRRYKEFGNCTDYSLKGGMCGTGINSVGVLPNDYLAMCHRSFMELIEEYDKSDLPYSTIDLKSFRVNSGMTFHKNELPKFTEMVEPYFEKGSTFVLTDLCLLIQRLALSGEIDSKYLDPKLSIKTARILNYIGCNCIFCNKAMTGSYYSTASGEIRLFLNGALDYIMEDFDGYK